MSDMPEKELPDYLITHETLLNRQVCSRLDTDTLVDTMQKHGDLISGTSAGWCLSDRPEVKPVKCEKYPTRTHYIFDC